MKRFETGSGELRLRGVARLAICAAALIALGGCKTLHRVAHDESCNKPQPYMRASSIPPLNIPQGLDSPDTSHALDVPKLDEPAPPPRRAGDPCLYSPPSFNVPQPNTRPQA